jgi:hypothetical protein
MNLFKSVHFLPVFTLFVKPHHRQVYIVTSQFWDTI